MFKITVRNPLSAANAAISLFYPKLLSELKVVSLPLWLFFAKVFVENQDQNSKFELAKHFKEIPTHKSTWATISKTPENVCKHKVLEAYFIKAICPTLNEQLTTTF